MAFPREEAYSFLELNEGVHKKDFQDEFRWHQNNHTEDTSERFKKYSETYNKLTTGDEVSEGQKVELFAQLNSIKPRAMANPQNGSVITYFPAAIDGNSLFGGSLGIPHIPNESFNTSDQFINDHNELASDSDSDDLYGDPDKPVTQSLPAVTSNHDDHARIPDEPVANPDEPAAKNYDANPDELMRNLTKQFWDLDKFTSDPGAPSDYKMESYLSAVNTHTSNSTIASRGTKNMSVSTENESSENKASKIAAELLREEEEARQKAEKRRVKNRKKKDAKKRKKQPQTPAAARDWTPEREPKTDHSRKSPSPVNEEPRREVEEDSSLPSDTKTSSNNNTDEVIQDDADIGTAFFVKAAAGQGGVGSKAVDCPGSLLKVEDREAVFGCALDESDLQVIQSRDIAKEGNILATNGEFKKAIETFTEAIFYYPGDHRYYGNRSFCYDLLGEYEKALVDAGDAVKLAPNWAKGYLRRGRALYGLKRYEEAEKEYQIVLSLEKTNEDAPKELLKCHTLQLMAMGFGIKESEAAAKEHSVIAHAIDYLLAKRVEAMPFNSSPSPDPVIQGSRRTSSSSDLMSDSQENGFAVRSLWVGNVNPSRVADHDLLDLFGRYGKVVSARILPEKHCAFVNFEHPQSAAEAVDGLQGYYLGGGYLLIRYPDNPKASLIHSQSDSVTADLVKKTGPVNGNECYFWRTTGCHFGKKCNYRHVSSHRGVDCTSTMVPRPSKS